MRKEKFSLGNTKNALTRDEMRKVTAGKDSGPCVSGTCHSYDKCCGGDVCVNVNPQTGLGTCEWINGF